MHTIARYQMENAALAIRAVEVLDKAKTIEARDIVQGVSACFWQGRMEELLPEIFVDGAHNEDGIRAFLETVEEDGWRGGRTLLFSVVKDKDYRRMIERITSSGLFDKIAIAHMHTGRAADLESMRQMFARGGRHADSPQCMVYEDVRGALEALIKYRSDKERIYIAGSLYLVGELKEALTDSIEGV